METISNNPAMSIIDEFKHQCQSEVLNGQGMTGQAHYGAVFREMRAQRTRPSYDNVECISRKELAKVEAARRQLQGIW